MKGIIKNSWITIIISLILSILLVVGFLSLILTNSNAKYKNNTEWNHYFESNGFYISSPTLSELNKTTIVNYYNYEDIEIIINNSLDENKISNYNIEYELECITNENYTCILDNNTSKIESNIEMLEMCYNNDSLVELEKDECINNNYHWKIVENEKKHTLKIIKNNNEITDLETINVNIFLKTKTPFETTLKGSYVFNINDKKDNNIALEIENNDTSCNLIINNNYTKNKQIKLNIDTNNLIFDDTDELYNKNIEYTSLDNTINSITIELNPLSTNNINLYKKNYSNECNLNHITYEILN